MSSLSLVSRPLFIRVLPSSLNKHQQNLSLYVNHVLRTTYQLHPRNTRITEPPMQQVVRRLVDNDKYLDLLVFKEIVNQQNNFEQLKWFGNHSLGLIKIIIF